MHSFLLIGQSNMAGRGFLNEAEKIDSERIYTLRNGRWQKMFRPLHPDRQFSGVCLGESFAEAYAKKHETNVGLICCADGGSTLDQWAPGELLFDNAVYQAKLAMRTSSIKGILWHQGEGDCDADHYHTYKKRFEVMANELRHQLGLNDIPIIVGGLGDFLDKCDRFDKLRNYTHVNDALKSIVADNKNMAFVSAEGLTSNPDNLHFNSASLYELGLRYFAVFESMGIDTDSNKNSTLQDIERSEMEGL